MHGLKVSIFPDNLLHIIIKCLPGCKLWLSAWEKKCRSTAGCRCKSMCGSRGTSGSSATMHWSPCKIIIIFKNQIWGYLYMSSLIVNLLVTKRHYVTVLWASGEAEVSITIGSTVEMCDIVGICMWCLHMTFWSLCSSLYVLSPVRFDWKCID